MDTFVSLSQTYSGRDKLMRTTGYVCTLLTGACNPQGKTSHGLTRLAQSLSAARTMMRFFDDIPMWTVTRASLFSQDKDIITRVLTIFGNLSIQAYFPIEKIAWASDNEILPLKGDPWWKAGIACWALFLAANILKNFRAIAKLRFKRARLMKQRKLESPESSSDSEIELRRNIAESKQQEFLEYVNLVKNLADLMMAVNWLPQGFLWAGKFSPPKTAFFGCISSLIGIGLLVMQQQQKAKQK